MMQFEPYILSKLTNQSSFSRQSLTKEKGLGVETKLWNTAQQGQRKEKVQIQMMKRNRTCIAQKVQDRKINR